MDQQQPLFTSDSEEEEDDWAKETPKTYIQQYLSHVDTEPALSRASKKEQKRSIAFRRSFAEQPPKDPVERLKMSHRLSTSLPSPGSLLTPKTNLQHLMTLGSTQTPLERQVSSTRPLRSSSSTTATIMHDAASTWGQKVSLSPMFDATSSSFRPSGLPDKEIPPDVFKRPVHRSFHLPDLPPKVPGNEAINTDFVRGEEGEEQTVVGHVDDIGDDGMERTGKTGQEETTPSGAIKMLEQLNKCLTMEKAKKVYDLSVVSSDEDQQSLNGSYSSPGKFTPKKSARLSSKGNSPYSGVQNRANRSRNKSFSMIARDVFSKEKIVDGDVTDGEDSDDTFFKSLSLRASGKSSKPETLTTGNQSTSRKDSTPLKEDQPTPIQNSPVVTRSLRKSSRIKINTSSPSSSSSSSRNMNSNSNNLQHPTVDAGSKSSVVDSRIDHMTSIPDLIVSHRLSESGSKPSSSTPLKRHKSIITSTKLQTSISDYLTPAKATEDIPSFFNKNSSSADNNDIVTAIGGLSPIHKVAGQIDVHEYDDNDDNIGQPNLDTYEGDKNSVVRSRSSKRKSSSQLQGGAAQSEGSSIDGENDDEIGGDGSRKFSPMKTPVINMSKRPSAPLSGSTRSAKVRKTQTSDRQVTAQGDPVRPKQSQLTSKTGTTKSHTTKAAAPSSSSRKRRAPPSTILHPKTVKHLALRNSSSMKIDKEALEELEDISEEFVLNILEAAKCYSHHAGRKTINEEDFVLIMRRLRQIDSTEDLYDLIREHLPMEERCFLIPCYQAPNK